MSKIMTTKPILNDISNALFNINDLKETIKAHGLRDIKRVHDGTNNEDTIEIQQMTYIISYVIFITQKFKGVHNDN